MSIFDFFKKKKKIEKETKVKKIEEKKIEKKVEKKEEIKEVKKEKKVEKPKKVSIPKPKRKGTDLSWKVLKVVHISEKATDLVEKNQYTFKVSNRANKPEIKRAIENTYGVDVLDVNIIKVPRKKRRLGRITGWRKGYKKAIIRVKEGQKIEVLPR